MDRKTYDLAMECLDNLSDTVDKAISQLDEIKRQEDTEGWDGKEFKEGYGLG